MAETAHCFHCGSTLQQEVSSAIVASMRRKESIRIVCSFCSGHLIQVGFCVPCSRATTYAGGPCPAEKALCMRCGGLTPPPIEQAL